MTGKIEDIRRTLNTEEEERVAGATPKTSAASSFTFVGAGTSLFGSSQHSGGVSLPKKTAGDIAMEFAFRGLAHLQRQLASECLFLLSYHTQLTVEEVVALIDLVRDLTNGDVGESSSPSLGEGLPLLDPLLDNVPSPYEVDASSPPLEGGGSLWQQQSAFYGSSVFRGKGVGDAIFNHWQPHHSAATPLRLKDAKEWEDELDALLWKRDQPQLLRCISTLILTVVCALDATHVLVDRTSHGPSAFGIGNALLLPGDHDRGKYDAANATQIILPIHQRLDPNSSAAEESWTRRDIWGLLLVPYGLLLRNTTAAATSRTPSPRATTPRSESGGIDIKGTYSQCLMVASQLKSLTFARLSLLPAVTSSLVGHGGGYHSSASIYDFYLSTLSEFTAQYIDALGTTGNFPITRHEWLDEEMNMAQTEWMEKEQRRQFGEWAGEPLPLNDDEDVADGPRAVSLLDRPDCLEDVFALVSSVCEAYPLGARVFWYTNENVGGGDKTSSATVLSPSRALQTLDLLQSENDSSLYVFLTFLSSLALADASKRGSPSGADLVHSYLSGSQAINPHSAGTDRHMHIMWDTIMISIRWYSDHLSSSDDAAKAVSEDGTNKSSAMLRGSNSATDETSTSYYYGLGGGSSPMNSGLDASSSSPEHSERGNQSEASMNVPKDDSKVNELGEVGRNTLMALLCLISNVASKFGASREFILEIRLPGIDTNDGSGLRYQDTSLEILFSLLTITSLPPEIMGMTFMAIANLIQPINNDVPDRTSDSNEVGAALSASGDSPIVRNDVSRAAAMRAWELLEMCQFIPIKYISQYSSYAAGAGSVPRLSSSNLSLQNSVRPDSVSNDKPLNIFPESTDYGMIHIFEHIESKLGKFPATEGFLFLLSTLVKVVGCPSDLGSQWRLRPGCAPYIEYVTDFILPRATGMEKSTQPMRFAGVSDECRLVERALEVVEAVIVRYVIPSSPNFVSTMDFNEVKERHLRNVKFAEVNLGMGCIVSEVFCTPDHLGEEETTSGFHDFQDLYLLPHDSTTFRERPERINHMLEASFGNQVPQSKSPGFAILSNLLSTNGGLLFEIIQMLLAKNGGPKDICTFNEKIRSKSLSTALFRETPPSLECAQESTVVKAREEQSIITEKSSQEMLSSLHQSIIQSLKPVLLYTYSEKGCYPVCNIAAGGHGASSKNAVLWRERIILLSIRILCAAAAREEAFIQLLKDSGSAALSVVPTLLFKGPIHGLSAHRFVHKEKVNVSRLSQLLTTKRSQGINHDLSPEILPIITEFVGYTASSLSDPQCIARCSFGIVSYIAHTLPHTQCVHSLCGSDDADGIRLATAFSKGLLSQTRSDTWDSEADTMKDAILNLILTNVTCSNSTFNNSSLSFAMLGLRGKSRHNCLNVILELISETEFVLDPRTSSTATKCFEIVYIVCKLGNAHGIPAYVRDQQLLFMEKLRHKKFWHNEIARYLGVQGHSSHSIFHEISNSFRMDHSCDLQILKRDNDVLHSIAFLLQGLAIELHCLTGQQIDRLVSPNHKYQSLICCLFYQPSPLLLTSLFDIPLGYSSNGLIRERLHRFAAPSNEVLKMCARPLSGFVDGCAGYEIIDIESLICLFQSKNPPNVWEETKEWALTWNDFVHRAHACSHITEAWTDVVRASLICSPLVTDIPEHEAKSLNTRTFVEILCSILVRMLSPSNFDAVGLYSAGRSDEGGVVEAECALPLTLAALGLVEMVIESSTVDGSVAGFCIAEEDVARVFSLIIGAISSCSDSGSGMHTNDGPAAILSCALTRVLVFSSEAEYSIFSQSTPGTINICSQAVAFLLRLSTASLEDGGYVNVVTARGRSIALAARSGLLSLFEHLKANEHLDAVGDFCSQIFLWDEITTAVTQLVRYMNNDDNDVLHLLQQIANFHGGAQLLAKAGVTTELLKYANEYSLSERAYLASHFGSSGATELKPPSLLEGQLSLLNALLTSLLTTSDRVTLAVDSLQVLKVYSATFERVIQLYPGYLELTTKFIEALQLTYSALDGATELNVLGSTLLNVDESLLTLERCVLHIMCQLSASPFPSFLLPPLPTGLINVEKIRALQVKNITLTSGNDRTWWDNISDLANKDDQPMQVPPTGSSAAARPKFASYRFDVKTQWTERKYQYAISTGKCLDLSILFLSTWINIVSKRNVSAFCIDAVAIAKGICRCSDASRVRTF